MARSSINYFINHLSGNLLQCVCPRGTVLSTDAGGRTAYNGMGNAKGRTTAEKFCKEKDSPGEAE